MAPAERLAEHPRQAAVVAVHAVVRAQAEPHPLQAERRQQADLLQQQAELPRLVERAAARAVAVVLR